MDVNTQGDDYDPSELTGWDDYDCSAYVEPAYRTLAPAAKPPEKTIPNKPPKKTRPRPKEAKYSDVKSQKLHRSPSLDMLQAVKATDALIEVPVNTNANPSVAVLPSSAVLEPVMILPVQDPRSPLVKPFAVYRYSSVKSLHESGPMRRDVAQVSVPVVTPAADDAIPPPPLATVEHLPALNASRDESTRRTVEGDKAGWLRFLRPTKKPGEAPSTQRSMNQTKRTPSIKLLCKNDKPTVGAQLAAGRIGVEARRRFSVAANKPTLRSENTHERPMHAPRRRSLSGQISSEDDDDSLNLEHDDEGVSTASALISTLTHFTMFPPRPALAYRTHADRSRVP